MSRTWPLLLFCLLLAAPATAPAQYAYATNATGAVYAYTTNADGSASLAGYTGPPWVVPIPASLNGLTVTSLGADAFSGDASVASVMIPAGLTNIAPQAFQNCPGLTSILVDSNNPAYASVNGVLFDITQSTLLAYPGGVGGNYTIPGLVTNIADGAFAYCSGLAGVTIPAGVTGIGADAFVDCYGLGGIAIPAGVSNIAVGMFAFCTNLARATFFGNITNVGDYAFDSCLNLTNVTIPNGAPAIGDSAFAGCPLESLTIPNGVTSIGDYAFYNCTNLTHLMLTNGTASIGQGAFANCVSLASLTLPAGVTNLGLGAFFDISLNSLYFEGDAPAAAAELFLGPVTIYYLPGMAGWSTNLAGRTPILWDPMIQTGGAGFGVNNNQFGFNIVGSNVFTVVVEACASLADPVWTPLQTVTLTNGLYYFSEPLQSNSPARFYTLAMP